MIGQGFGVQFFRLVNQKIRQDIPKFIPPLAWHQQLDDDFGEIWVPSHGCPWSTRGSCSMCNYGMPLPPTNEQIVQAVAIGLASFDKFPEILWVSAFDMLDPRDVPVDARRKIYRLLRNTSAHTIISESHPAVVNFDTVKECVGLLDGKTFCVELGVETMDDFIRAWCIHKVFTTGRIHRAIRQIREAGAGVYFNLFVGAPFLTQSEWVEDTVRSIHESLSAGVDFVVLLPGHVKAYTFCDWLYKRNLYQPPSLWTIVEVLVRIKPDYWSQVKLSWITTKDHPGKPDVVSPQLEDGVPPEFLEVLSNFDKTGDGTLLQPLLKSPAYAKWRHEFDRPNPYTIRDRIAELLPIIGENILGRVWWADNKEKVFEHLESDWKEYINSFNTALIQKNYL